ncbi:MAG: PSD1 domain-containing protein [Acidobacteria bacterium]|nr:PSD1 domain-containing protein [Acidobacteriota bacterium]
MILVVDFGSVRASQDNAKADFFEAKVRPILATSCYDCHTDGAKGGLRVDSREALLKGGRRGAALVPGQPENSLLIKAVSHSDEKLKMPKGGAKLKDEEIAALSQWIKDGAVWPATTVAKNIYLIKPEHKAFWSFQPVSNPVTPIVKGKTNNPIDAFLLAKLEANGLSFNAPADKRTLLRRATYDLTGLPPTAEEGAAFLADHSPDSFAKVVDRLLASSAYGERWGRHWLDLARYSDTLGMTDAGRNLQGWFPYSYTYRDWVIRALNEDLPYDQFLLQQIAADKLAKNDSRNLAALGFLSLSRGGLNANYHERIDDKIDVVSRGVLGLTVSCARCHNHKFDPIPTADYYSFYTIFNNSREPKDLPLLDPKNADLTKWEAETKVEEAKIEAEIAKMREKRYPELKTLYRTEPEIAKCLRSVYEAREVKNDEELQKFARDKDYNVYMLKRWRDYLQKAGNSEIWTLWQQLAALPEKDFKSKAPSVIASLTKDKINPLVAQAFQSTPATMREVADLYGKLLAAQDKPQPLANASEEQLRLVLRATDAPTEMPFSDYEQFRVSVDGQNENGRRTRLTSLVLAQAYRGAPPRAQSLEDVPEPKPGNIFLRGKPENKGESVRPQFLQILAEDQRQPFTKGSGRLELAEAIASKDNPLTARVMVNRIWQQHFGNGLVRTPSDFGTRGDAPTHPELLDYLARAFIANNWSMKSLHRMILLTRAYQQSSASNEAAHNLDPENKWLWRIDRRRLEIEELRDSLLIASGKLDRTMFGLPVSAQAWPYTYRRTIYSFIDRALVPNDFRVFDFADPNAHAIGRSLTTGPQQALMMLNSPFVIEQAKTLMHRSEIAAEKNPRTRITKLYQLIYGRMPSAEEIALGLKFITTEFITTENTESTEKTNTKNNSRITRSNALIPNDFSVPSVFSVVSSKQDAWQYGEGEYDDKADRVSTFKSLDYYINGMWRNSPIPGDPRATTASLTSKGGGLGDNKTNSAIRRWIAPFDGRISIAGVLEHRFENACRKCKGAYVRVVSNRIGTAGKWDTVQNKLETNLATLEVRRGDTIDFVAEAGKGTSGGEFKWMVTIRQLDGVADDWDSVRDFRQPSAGNLSAWDRYVQTLFAAAEFMILD